MADELVLHRGTGKSKCRSCQADIVFAASSTTGKSMPFEPDPNGRWTIENGTARYLGEPVAIQLQLGEVAPPAPQRYTSHVSSCPQAAQWRDRGVDRG